MSYTRKSLASLLLFFYILIVPKIYIYNYTKHTYPSCQDESKDVTISGDRSASVKMQSAIQEVKPLQE